MSRAIVRNIPHRAAGSANGKRMAEYSRAAMSKIGIEDVAVHELQAIVSFPEHAGCRVETPTPLTFTANTLGHSTETGPAGIRAEILDVGSGALANYSGKDARGKIILTELSYSPARHEKQRIAADQGAVGAIMMNWGPPENTAVPFGSVKPMWGNPTPDTIGKEMTAIPCIGVARVDGLKIRELATGAPVTVWIETHVENGWRPVQITIARLPAPSTSSERDDYILVGGHQDSWPGEAATDNAAGNACMMELARVFLRHRDKLRRGLTFRILDRPRNRHHGRLDLVRRSELGQPSQELHRLFPDRPAGVYRHHRMGNVVEPRTPCLSYRSRIPAA